MSSVRRAKTCKNKVSFRSLSAASKIAAKYDQTVYECPICFCWHCTSRKNWREEFVCIETHQRVLAECEKLRENEKSRKDMIKKNNTLQNENDRLKKELRVNGIAPEWLTK